MSKRKAKPNTEEKLLRDIELPRPEQEQDVGGLQERAVLVRLRMRKWNPSAVDDAVTQQIMSIHGATGDAGRFRKILMQDDGLRKLNSIFWAAWRVHTEMTLPWEDGGKRLLPAKSFFDYKRKMTTFEREFAVVLNQVAATFTDKVKEQKKRLGSMWKASDYPTEEMFRAAFDFAVLLEPIPTADDFRLHMGKEEREELKRNYDQEIRNKLKGAVQDVFAAVKQTVEELRDKLADPNTQVRSGTFTAIKRLVATLPQLNSVVQDPAIAELGKRLAEDLLSVPSDAVAHDTSVRGETQRKADAILKALKPLQQSWEGQA